MSKPLRVAILYGLLEEPRHARRLIPLLKSNGYEVVENPAEADLLITHSGGCYLLPKGIKAQIIIFVNPVYKPEKTLGLSLGRKIKNDFNAHRKNGSLLFWSKKTALNVLSIRLLKRYRLMWNGRGKRNFPINAVGKQVALIRNRNDEFSSSAAARELALTNNWLFQEVEGTHDDLWHTPAVYVEFINTFVNSRSQG